MRIIVYGVGAIGGTVAVALALSGREVVGIARGAQLAAIRADGLLLRTPALEARARFDCRADPTEFALRTDDAILLTMKSQDTVAALERLQAAGLRDQPIFCVQNGVANERSASQRFANVHGVAVMMPAAWNAASASARSRPGKRPCRAVSPKVAATMLFRFIRSLPYLLSMTVSVTKAATFAAFNASASASSAPSRPSG